jgi:hypothetical protein
MRIWKMNSCPKCRGAVYLDEDTYGKFLTCASCGWNKDLVPGEPLSGTGGQDPERKLEDGCEASPSCFECPLPECLIDQPQALCQYLWDRRFQESYQRHRHLGTQKAVAAVALELDVTTRSVYRALARLRQAA